MKKIRLLLLDNPNQDWSEGTEVEFIVEDFTDKLMEEVFFHNLRCLVRPNVRIFEAEARTVSSVLRHKYHEVGRDPKT